MRQLLLAVAAVAVSGVAAADGFVGFRFTASVALPTQLFGQSLGPDDVITGRIVYRTDVPSGVPIDGCEDCAGYAMDLVSGFSLEAGSLTLRYDSYTTTFSNDGIGLVPPFLEDVLRFGPNDAGPASYSRRLLVNGTPHPTAAAFASLVADPSTFASPALPVDPQPGNFLYGTVLISDGTQLLHGVIDFFSFERIAVPSGDYFHDGLIDGADYAVWTDDFRSPHQSSADGNRDGHVDAADYTIWRDSGGSFVASVPEPSGVVLVLMLSMLAAVPRSVLDVR